MKYLYLTPEEQLAMIRPRIAEAERRHFDVTLSAEGHPESAASLQTQIDSIEAIVQFLHDEETRINDQISSSKG
jgi:hypothetical protein